MVGALMKGHDFKRWRKTLDYSQKDAAEILGLKRRVVQYYEKGERDGDPVKIPRTVRLACYAISIGVTDYHGPEKEKKKDKDRESDEARAAVRRQEEKGQGQKEEEGQGRVAPPYPRSTAGRSSTAARPPASDRPSVSVPP